MEQKNIKVKDRILKCLYCGNDEFIIHDTLLNKTWLAAFGMEAFSNQGKAYICKNCGYKHEFYSSK